MVQRFDANTYPLDPGLRLLEASAGTGKTFALAHLCLRLITETRHPLERLLVVTYTEASADELRSRIGQRFQAALEGLEALEAESLAPAADPVLACWLEAATDTTLRRQWISGLLLALEQLDRADITTIHGFCRRTLRRMALSSGAAMDPALETDSTDLLQQVVQDIWRDQLLTLPANQLIGLRQSGLTPEAMTQALRVLDGEPHPCVHSERDDFDSDAPLAGQLKAWMERCWERFLLLWQRDGETLESCFRSSAAQWKAQGCRDTKPYSGRPRTDRCAVLNRWIADQNGVPSMAAIRAQKSLLRDYFHPGCWCSAARRCGESDPSLAAAELQQSIAALWDGPSERVWRFVLNRALRELNARRTRRGVISFPGLLAALDPGEEDAPWLEPLRCRYRAVLVDEFQDTDPLQWRLLRRTFAEQKGHLLLLVGDPKQAIYRFRGGDLATYLQARRQADRIDALQENFRTTPSLMHALNDLMQPGLVRSELPVPAVEPRSSAQAPPHGCPLQLLHWSGETPLTKTALAEELPLRLADAVLRLLQERDDLTPAQLCLLVSTHRQATDLRRALSSRGLPTRLVSQGDVFETEAAAVLQRLLDALAQPGDERRLRLLACSPLMGWSPEDLGIDSGLDQLALQLRAWAVQLPTIGLLGCLSDLLDGERMAELSDRGRMLGDLQQAARLVQEVMHRQGLDIASAATWLRRERLHPSEPVPEARQPHSDLVDSAIAVVTVHRSKGLEYPVVICPMLWEGPRVGGGPLWRDGSEGAWRLLLDARWGRGLDLATQEEAAAMAEAERLAYVALTRARSQLVLVWARATRQEGSPLVSWLFGADAVGQPIEQLTDERLSAALAERALAIDRRCLEPPDPAPRRWCTPAPTDRLSLGAVPQRIDRRWGRSSYSAWTATSEDPARHELGRDADPEGEEILDEADDHWPEDGPLSDFPRGASAGDCLHRILEQVSYQPSPQDPELIEAELRRAGLDLGWGPAVQQGLQLVVQTPLGGPLGDLSLEQLGPKQRHPELAFDLPVEQVRTADLVKAFQVQPEARFGEDYLERLAGLSVNSRGFLTGSIDLVFVDPSERWWVLDWKSNWIGERSGDGSDDRCGPRHYTQAAMESQMIHHHYPLQAHLYLVALHRHLLWRLPGYRPERHLGGYVYVFLRGMPGLRQLGSRTTPGRIVETAPRKRVLALDRLLHEGGL